MEGNEWAGYATDERASIVTGSVKRFSTESEALDNFIKRLKTEKTLFWRVIMTVWRGGLAGRRDRPVSIWAGVHGRTKSCLIN